MRVINAEIRVNLWKIKKKNGLKLLGLELNFNEIRRNFITRKFFSRF